MKKTRIIAGIVLVLGMFGSMVRAEQEGITFFNEYDEASAIRLRYIGAATATVSNAPNTITLTDDGTINTITLTAATTMSSVLASIMDATNSASARNFIPEYFCTLSTDTMSNKFVQATVFTDVSDGKWASVLKVDTSEALTYDVARVGSGLSGGIRSSAACWLKGINGNITGTGDVTLNVYVDDDKMWEKVYQSPVYGTSDGTVFTTNAIVSVNEDLNMYIGGGRRVLVRATRATTATTGGIGAVFTQR